VSNAVSRDWFRASTWDAQIAESFEQRLRRARPAGRAQYLRIQATHLLVSPDVGARQAGRDLLRRVIAEHPTEIEAKTATEQLGASLADDGRLEQAEEALRHAIRMCADSPIGKSGTTGTAELRLAEVILERSGAARADEVAALLDAVHDDVEQQKFFRDVVFRYLLASARLARLRHDPSAALLARNALTVAAETRPSLPRHPEVGRPAASTAQITELNQIAASG
jgi:hypothetical protein